MFQRKKQGAIDVIEGKESLVLDQLEHLQQLIDECLDGGQPMAVIDLGRVKLIDSAGLELLVDAQERYEERGGVIKLAAPNTLCQDILSVSGVSEIFDVYEDVAAAVGSFLR